VVSYAVALSGDTLVAGNRIWERDQGGPDSWGEVKQLVPDDPNPGEFGADVAIDGDLVVVGAPENDELGAEAGAAYVFLSDHGGPDNWGQVAKLTAAGAAAGDRLGQTVAIDGDTIVLGTRPGSGIFYPVPDDAVGTAHAFVRHRGGVDRWEEVQRLESTTASVAYQFGWAVAVSGGTTLVGTPWEGSGNARGMVYAFSVETESYPSFCDASDGSLAACPCANPGSPDTGCDLPQGTGGVGLNVLAQSTGPNAATLQGVGFPPASAPIALVKRSNALDPATPVVFGDGLRCVSTNPLVRLGVAAASGGVSTHVIGHGAMAGPGTYYYQLWFRSTPGSFCDPLYSFNQSNGRVLSW
jgi:hypothetical protein